MSNFWSGSVDNAISGSTPFGIYDTDTEYQTDGPKQTQKILESLID